MPNNKQTKETFLDAAISRSEIACPPWDDNPKLQRLPGWDPATSHTSAESMAVRRCRFLNETNLVYDGFNDG